MAQTTLRKNAGFLVTIEVGGRKVVTAFSKDRQRAQASAATRYVRVLGDRVLG